MPQILPLKDIVCVITRPEHQAQPLCQRLTDAGAQCILFPTLEIHSYSSEARHLTELIRPLSKLYCCGAFLCRFGARILKYCHVCSGSAPTSSNFPRSSEFRKRSIAHPNKIIFVSANAVTHALRYLEKWSPLRRCPVFAIGESTKRALAMHNIDAITPIDHPFSSENLLAHPLLQSVANEHIVIFSGEGGHTLLFETLKKRHAHVQQIPVYKRTKPKADMVHLLKRNVNYIVSTSGESLENLWKIAGEKNHSWLMKQHLVVISDRLKVLAHDLGFLHPALVSSNASDDAIFQTILLATSTDPDKQSR